MSWWRRFKNKVARQAKAAAHTVTHPVAAIKHVAKVIAVAEKKAEATVVKAAVNIDKIGTKALAVSGKAIDFVEKNAKTIKEVVDVAADVVEVVGVVTGQPEITAGAAALKEGADKALELAAQAKEAQDVAEKALLVARAIAQKKKLAVILAKTGDAMVAGGKLHGNDSLVEMGTHVQKGAAVVKKVADHSAQMHKIAKKAGKAIKNKDLKGGVGVIVDTVEEGIKIAKTSNQVKHLYKDVKNSKAGKKLREVEPSIKKDITKLSKDKKVKKVTKKVMANKTVKKTEKVVKKVVKEVKKDIKKKKGHRAPSAYNLFVGKQIKAGHTFKKATQMWQAQKKST